MRQPKTLSDGYSFFLIHDIWRCIVVSKKIQKMNIKANIRKSNERKTGKRKITSVRFRYHLVDSRNKSVNNEAAVNCST